MSTAKSKRISTPGFVPRRQRDFGRWGNHIKRMARRRRRRMVELNLAGYVPYIDFSKKYKDKGRVGISSRNNFPISSSELPVEVADRPVDNGLYLKGAW